MASCHQRDTALVRIGDLQSAMLQNSKINDKISNGMGEVGDNDTCFSSGKLFWGTSWNPSSVSLLKVVVSLINVDWLIAASDNWPTRASIMWAAPRSQSRLSYRAR